MPGPRCVGGAGDRWPGSDDEGGRCRCGGAGGMPEDEEGSLEGLSGSVFTLMGGEEAGGGVEEETLRWGRLPWAIPRLFELVHCGGRERVNDGSDTPQVI